VSPTFLGYYTGRIENGPSNSVLVVPCVFVAASTLPSNGRQFHIDTRTGGREMGPGGMMHVPSFIKIGSDIQKKLMAGRIYRRLVDLISLLSLLKNKNRLMRSACCLCIPPINVWMIEPISMTPEPISTALSVYLFICRC
jgi:hypothetical protein